MTSGVHVSRFVRGLTALALALAVLGVLSVAALAATESPSVSSPPPVSCTITWNNAGGGSWATNTNWTPTGTPGAADNVCINLNGTYTVVFKSSDPVSSTVNTISVGGGTGAQTLEVASSTTAHAILTATNGTTVASTGIVDLTNGDIGSNNATLIGTVTNAGTIQTDVANGGTRNLLGNITNTGSIVANATTTFNSAGTTLTNQGTVKVADGKALNVSNSASFTNTSGTIGATSPTGTGVVFESSGTFTQGGGATTGTLPLILDNLNLIFTGNGASAIALQGTDTVTGNIGSKQTLTVESTCLANASATWPASWKNSGLFVLTNGDTCGNAVTVATSTGSFTNAGTTQTQPAIGGIRLILGNLTNTGTLQVNATTTYNSASTTFDNMGAVNIATAVALNVGSGASFKNATGGSIVPTGTGVLNQSTGTFTQGAGTTTGSQPVILDDLTLSYTGSGASVLALRGSSSLTGNTVAGQTLNIQSSTTENAVVTAGASWTNGGAINLSNGDIAGNGATLNTSTGTLTNSGTITTIVANGGPRILQGNLTNTGTLAINQNATYNMFGATLNNQGTVAVGDGKQFTVNGGASFTNTSGTIGATSSGGTGLVFETSGTFAEGNGATTGSQPVVLDDLTLSYAGTGPSVIALRGTSNLTGNIVAGQTLNIQSTSTENATATAGASWTNGGTINLTNGDSSGNNETLNTSSGTLTNSGTITTIVANGGARTLEGNLTNTGTITLNQSTTYNVGLNLTNQGTITIANGMVLSALNSTTITNGVGGKINASSATGTGFLSQFGGTFNESGGTTLGVKPVILDDLTLNYTAGGASMIAVRGTSTLTGAPAAGQTLQIESTSTEHATLTSAAGIINKGTINLTNGDSAGNNATLTLTTGSLTNGGTIHDLVPVGGLRTINASVSSTRQVTVDAGSKLQINGTYTQTSTGTYSPGINSNTLVGLLNASGVATIAGTISPIRLHTFVPTTGTIFDVLHGASLTGTFALEKKGNVNSKGRYFLPTYTATDATLTVTQATAHIPSTAVHGASIAITGATWLANDQISISFTDNALVKTTYTTFSADGTGAFSTNETIPATSALGLGSVTITSLSTGAVFSGQITIT